VKTDELRQAMLPTHIPKHTNQNNIANESSPISQISPRSRGALPTLQTLQDIDTNGLDELSYYVDRISQPHQHSNITEKFDTAASSCMSSIDGRIVSGSKSNPSVQIVGFNNSTSRPTKVGFNNDNKKEYFVPNMPKDLVLLCGHAYASDGAAILTKHGGMVIKLNSKELEQFLQFASQYPIIKKFKVNNNTYEVDNTHDIVDLDDSDNNSSLYDQHDECYTADEMACLSTVMDGVNEYIESANASNVSTKHFNTKVHLSNGAETVFMLLMMGLSLHD